MGGLGGSAQLADAFAHFVDFVPDYLTHAYPMVNSTDLFHDVIDGMNEGLALFDSEERLVVCNDRYRGLYPECDQSGQLVPGVQYEDVVRMVMEHGRAPGDPGIEAGVAERLSQFRNHVNSFEISRPDGAWIRASNKKTRNGRTICVREDITVAKEARLAAHEHERNYWDILDNLEDIFYRIDREGRVSLVSPSVKDRLGYEPREIIGLKIADLYSTG